ncbi:MAG: hypothetical protein C4562_07480 [Actinobacteria bacterium]|nr:MAG: hypothetical protein C4562_07480 [Actinomycetota bacterium]
MKTKIIVCLTLFCLFSLTLTSPTLAKAKNIARGVFINYTKAKSKKPGGSPATDMNATYKYSGIHWTNPNVSYVVDASLSGIMPADAITAVNAGFDTWENEINPFGFADKSIIDYTYNLSAPATSGTPALDGQNTISWGSLGSGTIAATYYWYTRKGKVLVEFDMIFNKNMPWSSSGENSKFDIHNIAAHEAGHTLVLNDLYLSSNRELTMYGYGAMGETKKRDLGYGDMLGVERIYPVR